MRKYEIGMLVLVPRWPLSLFAPVCFGDYWDVGIIKSLEDDGNCLIYTHEIEDLEIHEEFIRPLTYL